MCQCGFVVERIASVSAVSDMMLERDGCVSVVPDGEKKWMRQCGA
jgi:hypothetical protein